MKDSYLQAEHAERRLDRLHRNIENSHLHAEGAATSREDQVNFMKALRTPTYPLRMWKQVEKVR